MEARFLFVFVLRAVCGICRVRAHGGFHRSVAQAQTTGFRTLKSSLSQQCPNCRLSQANVLAHARREAARERRVGVACSRMLCRPFRRELFLGNFKKQPQLPVYR
jgi:hypothetical protein